MPDTLDFGALHNAALAGRMWERWYPNGRRQGNEWCVGDIQGNPGSSLKINTRTGKWKDWSSSLPGGDLVALYAQYRGISMGDAGRELAAEMGLRSGDAPPAPPPEPDPYRLISPVPEPMPEFSPRRPHWMVEGMKHTASYFYRWPNGDLAQIVTRWEPPAGADLRKEILPYTYWEHEETGKRGWRNKAHPAPVPIYGCERIALDKDICVVEGEKAADALMNAGIQAVTWVGGSNRVHQADWSILSGAARIQLWPDADAPGEKCMRAVAAALVGLDGRPPKILRFGW